MIIYKTNSTSINFLHNVRNWRQLFVIQNYIPTIYRKKGYVKSSHFRLARNKSSKICIIFLLWWESTDNQCIAFMSVQVDLTPSWQDYYSIVLLLVSICFKMNHYKRITAVCQGVHLVWFSTFLTGDFKGFLITIERLRCDMHTG